MSCGQQKLCRICQWCALHSLPTGIVAAVLSSMSHKQCSHASALSAVLQRTYFASHTVMPSMQRGTFLFTLSSYAHTHEAAHLDTGALYILRRQASWTAIFRLLQERSGCKAVKYTTTARTTFPPVTVMMLQIMEGMSSTSYGCCSKLSHSLARQASTVST